MTLAFALLFSAAPALAQLPAALPAASSAVTLASHRASYDITLVRASQRDGVRSARGTMTYTLIDRCEGYTVESGIDLVTSLASGDQSQLEQRYAAWEAKNNRIATFRMITKEDGTLTESYHGEVKLDATGAGTAVYRGEKEVTYDLPAGTLLSVNHLADVLRGAVKGELMVNRTVLDGSFDTGPYRITTAVGPERRTPLPVGKQTGDAPSGTEWPFAMAYFPLKSTDDLPEYEVMMSVGADGVAHHLVQDLGGFTLAFELTKLERLPKPPC